MCRHRRVTIDVERAPPAASTNAPEPAIIVLQPIVNRTIGAVISEACRNVRELRRPVAVRGGGAVQVARHGRLTRQVSSSPTLRL